MSKHKSMLEDSVLPPMYGYKPRFKTHFNSLPDPGEVPTGPSLTVPDQSMSIKEILQRYARGLSTEDRERVPFYDGEEFVPDIKKLDLADIQELKEQTAEEIRRHRKTLSDAKAKSAAKKAADQTPKADAAVPSPSNQPSGDSDKGSQKKE